MPPEIKRELWVYKLKPGDFVTTSFWLFMIKMLAQKLAAGMQDNANYRGIPRIVGNFYSGSSEKHCISIKHS